MHFGEVNIWMLVIKRSIIVVAQIREIPHRCIAHFTKMLSDPLSHVIFKKLYKLDPCQNKKKKTWVPLIKGIVLKELYLK